MSAETEFRAALAAHGALTALVSQRIALNAVPQGSPLPAVAFTARHDPQFTLDNTVAADVVTFEVQCWAQTSVQASAVADAAQAAAQAAGAIVVGRSTGYDAETDLHADVLVVEWID